MDTSDITTGLLKAEQSSIITPAPSTNDTEKTAIRNFCQLNIRKKQLSKTSMEQRKEIRSKMNAAKKEITEYLAKNNIDILVLSKEDYKRLEEITAERGMPMVPMFARLYRTNKELPITTEVLDEAFDNISTDDFQALIENESPFEEALRTVIYNAIRSSIRTQYTSMKLCEAIDRSIKLYELPEAPANIVTAMLTFHTSTLQLKETSTEQKAELNEITKEINTLKPTVQSFFERANLTSQRVILDNVAYRLSRKVLIRHEKIGMPKMELWIPDLIKGITTWSTFENRMDRVKATLVKNIQSIPPTTKSEIVFQHIRQANT